MKKVLIVASVSMLTIIAATHAFQTALAQQRIDVSGVMSNPSEDKSFNPFQEGGL